MHLPAIPPKLNLKGKRVLVRVDWNVSFEGEQSFEDGTKIDRSISTVKDLAARGAIVLVLTHLGRPAKRDPKFSTKRLIAPIHKRTGVRLEYVSALPDSKGGIYDIEKKLTKARQGEIFLFENVRFCEGEEENAPALAKAYASLGDLFVNDAFASCHRAHTSVVGIAKLLPSYAGPSLIAEVDALSKLFKSKHPFVAIIGGAKLSTKMNVITALLKIADRVLIGGAMAHPFFLAKKWKIGKSFVEKEGIAAAKRLVKSKQILIPEDVVVSSKAHPKEIRVVPANKIGANDVIGDIGTATMQAWSAEIKKAKTIVWNGPVGISEVPAFSHGSLVVAQAIASRSKGPCFGVAGGGDTLPVIAKSQMGEWIDFVSTGGGAMLEFIAEQGKLPGLMALMKKKK